MKKFEIDKNTDYRRLVVALVVPENMVRDVAKMEKISLQRIENVGFEFISSSPSP